MVASCTNSLCGLRIKRRPGRDAASAIRYPCFFQQPKIKSRRGRDPDLRGFNRSADGDVKVSRVLAAGGRDKRAMDGARPSQDMDVLPREKRPPADRAR